MPLLCSPSMTSDIADAMYSQEVEDGSFALCFYVKIIAKYSVTMPLTVYKLYKNDMVHFYVSQI